MPVNDIRLDDGQSVAISFSLFPDIKIWEIEVQPPGYDGGEPIDTTTLRSTSKRTVRPRALTSTTRSACTFAYAVSALEDIQDMINIEQIITITYPPDADLAEESFPGFMKSFIPTGLSEGNRPTASVEIVCTNQDEDGNEVGITFS